MFVSTTNCVIKYWQRRTVWGLATPLQKITYTDVNNHDGTWEKQGSRFASLTRSLWRYMPPSKGSFKTRWKSIWFWRLCTWFRFVAYIHLWYSWSTNSFVYSTFISLYNTSNCVCVRMQYLTNHSKLLFFFKGLTQARKGACRGTGTVSVKTSLDQRTGIPLKGL